MSHPIHRVIAFEVLEPYVLLVRFDDQTQQRIDFRPVLAGQVFGPLRELKIFNQVHIDPEVHALVWPNGADFDSATLHDWHEHTEELTARAQLWESTPVQ